ncbi:MAG: hypothetical protein ACJA2S_000953 [Cyclobacteriaceae bacterium]|jgi:hypothetical protein
MNVPEITEVKNHLDQMKQNGLVENWELPYENLLTRRTAAIFFVDLKTEDNASQLWAELEKYNYFYFRENTEKQLSKLKYRVTFNPEENEVKSV